MTQESKTKEPQPQPPPRRNWPDAVGRDTGGLSKDIFVRAGFRNPTLVLRWTEIAGPEIARFAQPIRLSEGPSGGVLTLKAEPGAALFLQHESRSLCERINTFLGFSAVSKLRFIQGSLTQRPARKVKPRPVLELSPIDPAIRCQAPESLRAALLRLAQARRRENQPD